MITGCRKAECCIKSKGTVIKMELIMISNTKLKVMLSAEDMKTLDFDPLAAVDISGRVAFRNILKEAKDRCGFDAIGDRVFVQYYPEKHGGCEMFVTKLEDEIARHSRIMKGNGTLGDRQRMYIIYSFDSIDNLLATCKLLKQTGYSGESSAYAMKLKKKRYYLHLDSETHLAGENLGVLCGTEFYYILTEHGRLLCNNAVEILGKLA